MNKRNGMRNNSTSRDQENTTEAISNGANATNKQISKQLRNYNDNCESEDALTFSTVDHDKMQRVKGRKKRDVQALDESQILAARLRSNSGKLYTSTVSVEASSAPNSPVLSTVQEEIFDTDSSQENSCAPNSQEIEMCPKEDCCKGTSQIIAMIAKMQKSLDGVLKQVSTNEIITSNTAHRLQDLTERVNQNENAADDLERELQDTKIQLEVVSNIVIKQDEQIAFLKRKVNEIQKREMASNIVITGIPETKYEQPIALFNRFVEKGLEM